jgi:D-threo-aldose 1-dehydrogenase
VRIAIGADHNGFVLKETVKRHLQELGHEVTDYGVPAHTLADYPDIAEMVARQVAAGQVDRAVLACGTGLGMAIVANKVPGVRAASVTDPYSAERAVKSNDAQVLCLGGKVIAAEVALLLVDHWLSSEFQGGESARKVSKIQALDATRFESSRAEPRAKPGRRISPRPATVPSRSASVKSGEPLVGSVRSTAGYPRARESAGALGADLARPSRELTMDPQLRRPIGSTAVLVDQLSLGLVPLGNLYKAVSDEQAQAVLQRWWDLGLRTFDVAPVYGFGIAEQRLGRFLHGKPRDEYVISTKVGRLIRAGAPPDPALFIDGVPYFHGTPHGVNPVFDFSHDGVRRSLEESLERLGIDRVDIVYIHDPDDYVPQALSEAYPAMAALRDQGLLRALGIGVTTVATPLVFARETQIDCIMLAGRYTLLEQPALKELLPLCLERGISVVNGGVLNSGFLADPRLGAYYEYHPTHDHALVGRSLRIKGVSERYGVPLKAAAIQFAMGHPSVASVVIGASSVEHVDECVRMFQQPVPAEMWEQLKSDGLVDMAAPSPANRWAGVSDSRGPRTGPPTLAGRSEPTPDLITRDPA